MRRAALIACIAVTGCAKRVVPMTRAQLATVTRAVEACTDASGKLTPYLKNGDRAGATNAAVAARNLCSSSRAKLVAAVGTGTPLDACYFAVDRQEAVQRAELTNLDSPTLEYGSAVVAALDEAIRQQTGCSAAIEAAERGAS
jgi:hypothetical protein